MYAGSFEHGKIIEAYTRNVPGTYVRDYRDNGGYITICRGYKDIKWRDQTTTANVYRQVPKETLVNLPRGNVTAATIYSGVTLVRPGWRTEFRKSMMYTSRDQQKRIEKFLGAGEVFPGGI